MKRALVFAAVISMFAFAGLAQFSGEWKGSIAISGGSISLGDTSFSLTYSIAGWDITSNSTFNSSSGWTDQSFDFEGAIGPVSVNGSMAFDPTGPAYKSTDIEASMDFAGMSIVGKAHHVVGPYIDDDDYLSVWLGCDNNNQTPSHTGDVLILYTLDVSVDPFEAVVRFADCCTGTEFYDATISLDGLGLCCGVTYDAELYFKKSGFQYAKFNVDHLFDLCCGISFGASVKFTTTGKELSVTPSWAGIEGCVTVYGDLDANKNGVYGWKLYGWKIVCEFSDCNKLEILTATDPSQFDVFEDSEFEYFKIETCGAACCGGNWSLSAQTFFKESGTLFGVTRSLISATVPVMDNLSLNLDMSLYTSGTTSITIGWDFTF